MVPEDLAYIPERDLAGGALSSGRRRRDGQAYEAASDARRTGTRAVRALRNRTMLAATMDLLFTPPSLLSRARPLP